MDTIVTNIAVLDSVIDTLKSNEASVTTVILQDQASDKRRFIEEVTTTVTFSHKETDTKVLRLLFASPLQITTYPLSNQPRRRLNFFSVTVSKGFLTDEMMLMNTAQIYDTTRNITSRQLRWLQHISDMLIIGGITWSPFYVPTLGHRKVVLPGHISEELTIPTNSFSTSSSSIRKPILKLLDFISDDLVLSTGIQVINYSSAKVKNTLTTLAFAGGPLPTVGSVFYLEYTNKVRTRIKLVDHGGYSTNNIEMLTGSFTINYGGENTFYSLNGLFNFFKYKYPALMQTAYRILISRKLINMYNKDMVCIESHKAGYKRVTVAADFLQDENGYWLSKDTLPNVFYEDKFTFYSSKDKLLYTYDFDSIKYTNKMFYNVDSDLLPINVDLYLDPTYMMPYIMPRTSEGNQRITQVNEYWNFLQINNVKLIDNFASLLEAEPNYVHEVLTPTNLFIDKIIFRYKDTFILQGSIGAVERVLYSVNKENPANIREIYSYNGSEVLYSAYPIIYYSEYNRNFTDTSIYNKIVKFNIATLDFEATKIDHLAYMIIKDLHIWHLYKKASNEAYYIFREDTPDEVFNLTVYLNLGEADILEFNVFNAYDIYVLTSDRKIFLINVQTMVVSQVYTQGTPILFLKFTHDIGCVLTRKDTDMFFEELQPILWSRDPSKWITPYDMHKGELLLPYELYKSVLHKRIAPIKTQLNTNIVERISDKYIELKLGVTDILTVNTSDAVIYPVKVGSCTQKVYGSVQSANVNHKTYSFSSVEYSKSLDMLDTLNEDGTFTLEIADLPIPESLTAGFKLYEK